MRSSTCGEPFPAQFDGGGWEMDPCKPFPPKTSQTSTPQKKTSHSGARNFCQRNGRNTNWYSSCSSWKTLSFDLHSYEFVPKYLRFLPSIPKHVPTKTGTYVPSFRKSTYQLFEIGTWKAPVLVILLPQNAWQRVRYVDLVLLFWEWRYLFCLKNRTNVYVSLKGTAQCCTHFFKAVLQKTLELVKKKIHVPRTVLVFFQKIQKVSTPLPLS